MCIHAFLYQALVYEHSGQHLEIELFDEDPDKDDFLGRCHIHLCSWIVQYYLLQTFLKTYDVSIIFVPV